MIDRPTFSFLPVTFKERALPHLIQECPVPGFVVEPLHFVPQGADLGREKVVRIADPWDHPVCGVKYDSERWKIGKSE
jgi:hypothetical protein